jgi:pyruvate dehydrogenase E2 component (dihydrolipoamide acetyltransferase)
MAEFIMPSLGADMEAGTVLEWLVKPGATVKRGDIIVVVGTEKGEIEVEIFEDGIIDQVLAEEGAEVPVGQTLAIIRKEGEEASPPATEEKATVAEQAAEPVAEAAMAAASSSAPVATPSAPTTNGHRIRVSPIARKLAAELGVDLSTIEGSGPHGAISKSDVEAAAEAAKAQAAPPPAEPRTQEAKPEKAPATSPTAAEKKADKAAKKAAKKAAADAFQLSMRKAIAAAMSRSNADIPHYYLETRIDMSAALSWLEAENSKRSIKDRVLPAVLLIKAVALGLARVPELNGFWIDDRLQPAEGIHIGFAIALRQGGLITPAIHHADLQDMDELMASMRDLIMRTRAGRLRSSELTDSTVVLTNLGDMGVEKVYGVIYPPQVALVGFGKTSDEVWVENGLMGVRPVVHATLAGDHRATDGRTGGEFLGIVNELLQEPAKLWE